MAMNNWGGITEHMSKKPRRFLRHNRVKRDITGDRNYQLTKNQIEEAEELRRKSLRKEYIIYLIVFVVLILGVSIFIR